jgi:hypothetical protein
MVEDRDIIMTALRHQRDWLILTLDLRRHYLPPDDLQEARLTLARINGEIARRCWNRLAAQAARLHSPI